MKELLNEMEDYRDSLITQSKETMDRIVKHSFTAQGNEQAREYMSRLTGDYETINMSIDLINFKIKKVKRIIDKGEV